MWLWWKNSRGFHHQRFRQRHAIIFAPMSSTQLQKFPVDDKIRLYQKQIDHSNSVDYSEILRGVDCLRGSWMLWKVMFPRWLGQKSTFYPNIHIVKIPIFTKFTFLKSHFSRNSHFWNLNFHKIHISEITIVTKFTFFKHQILGNFWIKRWFLPPSV